METDAAMAATNVEFVCQGMEVEDQPSKYRGTASSKQLDSAFRQVLSLPLLALNNLLRNSLCISNSRHREFYTFAVNEIKAAIDFLDGDDDVVLSSELEVISLHTILVAFDFSENAGVNHCLQFLEICFLFHVCDVFCFLNAKV